MVIILIETLDLIHIGFALLFLLVVLIDGIIQKIREYIDDKNQMKKENLKNNFEWRGRRR